MVAAHQPKELSKLSQPNPGPRPACMVTLYVYNLGQPGVHDGVDQDVRLYDAGRLGGLAQQAQQKVLPVLGAHLVLVEEGVHLGEIHLGEMEE